MYQLMALGVIAYYLGVWARNQIPALVRFSIPAPVVGGLPFAIIVAILEHNKILGFEFNGTLQTALMIMFFCTIGMNASITLLKKGTMLIMAFFAIATVGAVLQNILGMGVAEFFGIDPRLGIIGGAVTLTGGLGTAGAFGPIFENELGVKGAAAAGIACATFGMIAGSMTGGPMAEWLIKRNGLKTPKDADYVPAAGFEVEVADEDDRMSPKDLLNNLAWVLVAIGIGSIFSYYVVVFFKSIGSNQSFPAYLGAMFAAIIIRNVGDISGKFKIDSKIIDSISDISLAVFISMAIVSMKLAQLINLAGPLITMMILQLIFVLLMAYFMVYLLFGKDYEATVISAGFIGFMMGATSNALVSMQAVSSKYGYAAKAYFIVPIVGAFLIDIPNAFIINYMASAKWVLAIFGM
jgi:ESS family glutamate:Na+ symporter